MAPQDVSKLAPPFILHLDLLDYGGSGHFVTVVQVDDPLKDGKALVRYIDGATAEISHKQLQDLLPTVTGFVLADEEVQGDPKTLAVLVAAAIALSLPVCALAFWHAAKSRGNP